MNTAEPDVRWRQRLANYVRALDRLTEAFRLGRIGGNEKGRSAGIQGPGGLVW